jgi:hypothetical protein
MKRLTQRGFGMYAEFEYQDYPGQEPQTFQVQQSSSANQRKVWVGKSGIYRGHLGEDEARAVRDGLNEFLDGAQADSDAHDEFLTIADDVFDRIDRVRIRRGLDPDSDELERAVTRAFGGGAWSRWKQWRDDRASAATEDP